MSSARTIGGGCHCGAVRYEADVDLSQTVQCNCSICRSKGLILTFVPGSKFRLLSGEDSLTEYRFNKHAIDHRFCSTCGVQPFAFATNPDGSPGVAVNLRSADEVDLGALHPMAFDGRSL